MALSPTVNMGLQKPEPNVTSGPVWAQMINDVIDLIDNHDHSAGKGAIVGTAGFVVDNDLDFNGNDAIDLRSARFSDAGGTLVTVPDKRCVYVNGDNLYYNNSSGAAVQITNGTSVVSSITGAFSATTPGGYPYSVTGADAQKVLLVDTASARTVNLPAATTAVLFCIKDTSGLAGTNKITIHPNGTNTIEGVNADYLLDKNYGWWFLISDGVSAWHVAEAAPNVIPAGSMQMYGGASVPAGWLLCDGSAVSRTTYAKLFAAISTTFGAGDGSSTFNIPDLRQRFPLGKAASGTGASLGSTGGSIDHTHSVPAHHHAMGTGADFNITSSGSHSHSIDHDHGVFSSGLEDTNHSHTIDHDHGSFTCTGSGILTTDSGGSHYHRMVVGSTDTAAGCADEEGLATAQTGPGTYSLATIAGTATLARSSTDGAHTHTIASHAHTIDVPLFNAVPSGTVSANHAHPIDVPAFTGTSGLASHTHTSGNFAGRVGLVTGGVDGNAAMTSGATNPPFISLNYIIKT